MANEDASAPRYTLTGVKVEKYSTMLKEKYRPPSRGGNTRALHLHILTIASQTYSFFALGSQRWVYASDTVSFDYEIKDGKYRNIIKETIRAQNKEGHPIIRGNRSFKKTLRTANTRAPVSRREWRD